MATYYGKFGSSGGGGSTGDPGNLYEMLTGTGSWSSTIAAGDTIVACPGSYTSSAHFDMESGVGSAGASNWLTVRLADPGEFTGENGTELEFILGTSYNHRFLSRAFTRWIAPSGSKIIITKASGDGLGFWQAIGPMRFEGTLHCRSGNLTSLGSRYINAADEQNGELCWYDKIILEHGRNSGAGPGLVIRDAGNHVRIEEVEIILSTDVTTETYPSGFIRCGSQSNFDFGNLMEIERLDVTGTAAETDHLVEAGALVRIGSCDTGLMKPYHDVTDTVNNDFGAAGYTIGIDGQFKSHAGSGQGRIDLDLSSPPTLQGNDPQGVAKTIGIFPTTQSAQIHEFRPLRVPIKELALHETAATREISVELLVNPTLDALADTRNVWAEVTYLADGGSSPTTETTRAATSGTSLTASTASWSSTTYLTQTLTKRKLTITTASNVTAESLIKVRVYVAIAAAATTDFILMSGRTLVEA